MADALPSLPWMRGGASLARSVQLPVLRRRCGSRPSDAVAGVARGGCWGGWWGRAAMSEQSTAKMLRPYATGGTAACFASFCIHPIDVTKVRLQVVPPPATGISVAKEILANEGVRGLYAG